MTAVGFYPHEFSIAQRGREVLGDFPQKTKGFFVGRDKKEGKSISLAVLVGGIWMLFAYWYHPVMASLFTFKGGDYGMKALLFVPAMTGFSAILTLTNGLSAAAYATAIVQYQDRSCVCPLPGPGGL